ncbi:hypothetical protein VNO77_27895 [Canavalia gladiata]|uniref:Uncharacterized protein n=1 Tax=Canavalia gladiata TaxID=3824 RepID=A0AAN9Q6X5_CANGL
MIAITVAASQDFFCFSSLSLSVHTGTLQQQRHLRASYVSAFAAHLSLSVPTLVDLTRITVARLHAHHYLIVVTSSLHWGNYPADASWAPQSLTFLYHLLPTHKTPNPR